MIEPATSTESVGDAHPTGFPLQQHQDWWAMPTLWARTSNPVIPPLQHSCNKRATCCTTICSTRTVAATAPQSTAARPQSPASGRKSLTTNRLRRPSQLRRPRARPPSQDAADVAPLHNDLQHSHGLHGSEAPRCDRKANLRRLPHVPTSHELNRAWLALPGWSTTTGCFTNFKCLMQAVR